MRIFVLLFICLFFFFLPPFGSVVAVKNPVDPAAAWTDGRPSNVSPRPRVRVRFTGPRRVSYERDVVRDYAARDFLGNVHASVSRACDLHVRVSVFDIRWRFSSTLHARISDVNVRGRKKSPSDGVRGSAWVRIGSGRWTRHGDTVRRTFLIASHRRTPFLFGPPNNGHLSIHRRRTSGRSVIFSRGLRTLLENVMSLLWDYLSLVKTTSNLFSSRIYTKPPCGGLKTQTIPEPS